MNPTAVKVKSPYQNLWIPVSIAFIIVQILFFIDEGYYDFRWMKSFGNWIVFVMYFGFLLVGQLLIKLLFFRKKAGFGFLTISLGILMGVGLAFFVFSLGAVLS